MGRKKTYKREELIERAMYIFWDKGYINTSMSDLSSATGVDKKCLFREFISKELFFEEVLVLYTTWDLQHFDALFSTEPLGVINIKNFLDRFKSSDIKKGCLLNKSIVQRNLISEKHFKIIEKSISHLEKNIYKNLQAAKKNGELKNSRSPRELSKYLVYTTQGILSMSQYDVEEGSVNMVINSIMASL